MEFLKKLFRREKPILPERQAFMGLGPMQSQDEQNAIRSHMEEEMAGEKERRETTSQEPLQQGEETETPKG